MAESRLSRDVAGSIRGRFLGVMMAVYVLTILLVCFISSDEFEGFAMPSGPAHPAQFLPADP